MIINNIIINNIIIKKYKQTCIWLAVCVINMERDILEYMNSYSIYLGDHTDQFCLEMRMLR